MAKLMSKSELVQKITQRHSNGLTRKDVKGVIESLAQIGYKELKKTGAFLVPGFAKFVVIKKPATKQRRGKSFHKGANNIQGEAGSEDR
jgi:DNA-binding protein HU-beta